MFARLSFLSTTSNATCTPKPARNATTASPERIPVSFANPFPAIYRFSFVFDFFILLINCYTFSNYVYFNALGLTTIYRCQVIFHAAFVSNYPRGQDLTFVLSSGITKQFNSCCVSFGPKNKQMEDMLFFARLPFKSFEYSFTHLQPPR